MSNESSVVTIIDKSEATMALTEVYCTPGLVSKIHMSIFHFPKLGPQGEKRLTMRLPKLGPGLSWWGLWDLNPRQSGDVSRNPSSLLLHKEQAIIRLRGKLSSQYLDKFN